MMPSMRADGIRPYKNTLCDFRSKDRIISENGAFFCKTVSYLFRGGYHPPAHSYKNHYFRTADTMAMKGLPYSDNPIAQIWFC